jgi:hypothetical protein
MGRGKKLCLGNPISALGKRLERFAQTLAGRHYSPSPALFLIAKLFSVLAGS